MCILSVFPHHCFIFKEKLNKKQKMNILHTNNNNNSSSKRHDNAFDGEQYLKKHNLDIYLGDAVKQMLWCKKIGGVSGGGKNVDPATFLHKYFTSVKKGDHIFLREFSYIKSTPWNRLTFITKFRQTFQHLGTDCFSCKEFHSLLCLICPDFSKVIVQRSVNTASCQLVQQSDTLSFTDFSACFSVEFYYLEFSRKVAIILQDLTVEQDSQGKSKLPSKSIFRWIKEQIYNQENSIFAPPMPLIEDVCRNGVDLQYHDFILSLGAKLDIF